MHNFVTWTIFKKKYIFLYVFFDGIKYDIRMYELIYIIKKNAFKLMKNK